MKLAGHTAELSNCQWNFDERRIATSSLDGTACLWDIRVANQCHTITGHKNEALDIAFNYTGTLLATASADKTCKLWNISADVQLVSTLCGHTDEISRIAFNPIGSRVLTASADNTARIWNVESGSCEQILDGHTDEVFSCAFNYPGMADLIGVPDLWSLEAFEFIQRNGIEKFPPVYRKGNAILTASKDNTCKIWR